MSNNTSVLIYRHKKMQATALNQKEVTLNSISSLQAVKVI